MMILSRRLVALLAAAAGLAAPCLAAPDSTQDLGQGLAYFRVHALADDSGALITALEANGALVLDVRYATARKEDAALFDHALAQHRGPALLCVLVSPATPPALADSIGTAPVRLTTFGVTGSVPAPRVAVAEQAPETDRRAYEAFDSGTPLAGLISGKIKKERYDEVSLMNDFSNGNTSAEPPPEPDLKSVKDAPVRPAALIDRVLQRAVDLDRALAAIKPRS
jgi:hypothetical protein